MATVKVGQLLPLLALLSSLVAPSSSQCPSNQCSCSTEVNGLTLYCRGQDLSVVPQFKDTTLTFYEVTLSDNHISSLQANAFKTTNGAGLVTQVLDISENPITFVSDDAFAGVEDHVIVLKLHAQSMNTFPATALQRLGKLKELHLKGFALGTLPSGALTGLNQLQVLSMDACGLEELNENDFTGQVTSLQQVDLPSNGFTAVPSEALSTLQIMTKLNLAGNRIPQIDSDTFANMAAVEEINLEQNGITTIKLFAFRGAEDTIKRLYLANNKNGIVVGDLEPMMDLYSLEELDLSYNTLASLPSGFFQNMQRLESFSIQANLFTALTPATFAGLGSSLTELNCIDNDITSIGDGSFASLTGLTTLRLERNTLGNSYSPNTFKGLENTLTYLSLMYTDFTELHWGALWSLHSLQTLDLEGNSIQNIPELTFKTYTSLTLLDLKKNRIESLTQRSLMGLQKTLEKIYLDDNEITTLSECVFYKFNVLEEIGLRNNPLMCDCHAAWLRRWIDGHSPNTNFWKCASPDKHAGKFLKDISESELTCDDGNPPLEECEDFTTTPPTTIQPTEEVTMVTGPTYPLQLNVTDIGPSSFRVSWIVLNPRDVIRWQVTCSHLQSGQVAYSQQFAVAVRSTQIPGLSPSTEYFICVTPEGSSILQRACTNEITAPDPGAVITPTQKTLIILGVVLGVVVTVALIIVLVCYLRWRNKHAHPKFKQPTVVEAESNIELPQVSDQSKRFSKAKSHSLGTLNGASNMDLDRRLDGFTPDERNRILHLFSNSGASTLSMLSTHSQRYTHDPSFRRRPGYLNPMQVGSQQDLAGRLDSGEYQEIPADTYDEIPHDNQDTYNEPFEDRPKSTGALDGASNYI